MIPTKPEKKKIKKKIQENFKLYGLVKKREEGEEIVRRSAKREVSTKSLLFG